MVTQIAKNNRDNNEEEFEMAGIYSFFNNEDDKNINWCKFFGLKESFDEANTPSRYLMEAQEQSKSVKMLNEPEEDAWDFGA